MDNFLYHEQQHITTHICMEVDCIRTFSNQEDALRHEEVLGHATIKRVHAPQRLLSRPLLPNWESQARVEIRVVNVEPESEAEDQPGEDFLDDVEEDPSREEAVAEPFGEEIGLPADVVDMALEDNNLQLDLNEVMIGADDPFLPVITIEGSVAEHLREIRAHVAAVEGLMALNN
jgi:hypothetical protein